jgi:hypothetical protein
MISSGWPSVTQKPVVLLFVERFHRGIERSYHSQIISAPASVGEGTDAVPSWRVAKGNPPYEEGRGRSRRRQPAMRHVSR